MVSNLQDQFGPFHLGAERVLYVTLRVRYIWSKGKYHFHSYPCLKNACICHKGLHTCLFHSEDVHLVALWLSGLVNMGGEVSYMKFLCLLGDKA